MPENVGFILAAGLGTRLRPHTLFCPKPLLSVAGIEALFAAIHQLHEAGIRKIIVNSHHLPDQIHTAIHAWAPRFPQLQMRISEESNILGTGGAILKILKEHRDWLGNASLLVYNGDIVSNVSLETLMKDRSQNCLAISEHSSFLNRYNPIWFKRDGYWGGIGPGYQNSGMIPAHFLGIYYFSHHLLQILSEKETPSSSLDLFNGLIIPALIRGQSFMGQRYLEEGISSKEYWFDMGTPADLLETQRFLIKNFSFESNALRTLKLRYPKIEVTTKGSWVSGLAYSPKEVDQFSEGSSLIIDETAYAFSKLHPQTELLQNSVLISGNLGNSKITQPLERPVHMANALWMYGTHQRASDYLYPERLVDSIDVS